MNVRSFSAIGSGLCAALALAGACLAQIPAPPDESAKPSVPMLPLILGTAALCTLIAFTVLRVFWRIHKRNKKPRL